MQVRTSSVHQTGLAVVSRQASIVLVITALVLAATVPLWRPTSAAAVSADSTPHIYWTTDWDPGKVGRSNLDGSSLVPGLVSDAHGPLGVTYDRDHVFWANNATDSIGRANLDGTGVDNSFITSAGAPVGITVDNTYLYWVNESAGTISRAKADGTGRDDNFISGLTDPGGLATDSKYIYWTDETDSTIGRAKLDGSGVNKSFVSGVIRSEGVTVTADHIYWASQGPDLPLNTPGAIGRANIDGSGVIPQFIAGAPGPGIFEGISANGDYLYFADASNAGGVGRARLDGTDVVWNLISRTDVAYAFGIDAAYPAPQALSMTPSKGPDTGGTTITITGKGFDPAATVSVGGAPCTIVGTPTRTSITCRTTSHAAGLVDVVVDNPDGQEGVLPAAFTYEATPPAPTSQTTLRVNVVDGPVAAGERSALIRKARTNGRFLAVRTTCSLHGNVLPRRVAKRLCDMKVVRVGAATVRVTAAPICTTGLRMTVRLVAKKAGATRKAARGTWRASNNPPITCKVSGTG